MTNHSLRPGFHLEGSFRAHKSPIRQITYNSKAKYYVSLDDKSIRAWRPEDNCKQLLVLNFPAFQPSFITCMIYVEKMGLLFAAALDNTLKLYNGRLKLRASLPWNAGAVMSMVFNEKDDELITAGSEGVKVWYSAPDYASYNSTTREAFERPQKCDSGELLNWTFGKHQRVLERMSLRVPGTASKPTTPGSSAQSGGEWVQRMILSGKSNTLVIPVFGNIYGFDVRSGTRIYNWEGLHSQPITGVIFLPHLLTVFTSSQDASVVQWRLMVDGSLQLFKKFHGITTPVSGMVLQEDGQAILTSTLDGMVTLWSFESLEIMFRMKVTGSILGLTFRGADKFFFHYGQEAKVMRLKHVYSTLRTCNSPPIHMHSLENGRILILFDDGCVRLMDSKGKFVLSTVPQLSTKSVSGAEYCDSRKQLVVLLGNGHIHIWDVFTHRPPKLVKVWNHLAKESPCTVRFLDKRVIPSGFFSGARGVSSRGAAIGDHLILGTKTGEVSFCDMDADGKVTLRSSGFEKEAVRGIAMDHCTGNILIHAKRCVKILRLSGLQCASTVKFNDEVVKIGTLGGRALVGGKSGSLSVLDLCSGRHLPSTKSFDHNKRVTAVSASTGQSTFLTGSEDGSIRIFDRDKQLCAMLLVAEPVNCVCYLNGKGDILVGVGTRMLVAKADVYHTLRPPPPEPVRRPDSEEQGNLIDSNHSDVGGLDRYMSGFNIWRPNSPNAPRIPESPISSPRKSIAFDNMAEKFSLLAVRRSVGSMSRKQSEQHPLDVSLSRKKSSLRTEAVSGQMETIGNGSEDDLAAQSQPTVPIVTKYSIDLPIHQNDNDKKSPLVLRNHSSRSSMLEKFDMMAGSRNSLTSEKSASEYESDECSADASNYTASQESDQENKLKGLESLFKKVAPVVASREAFYPGLAPPRVVVDATMTKTTNKKKTKKKRRKRRRRKKKMISNVGLSWGERAEELRKAALEEKVVVGVHELQAQESGTKAAVRCLLPSVTKLAHSTPAQPLRFFPRNP